MKRNTELAELKTEVKHNTLHKVTARGALGRKMVNRTKKSLRITWVKTTHCFVGFTQKHPLNLLPKTSRVLSHALIKVGFIF